MNGIPAIVVTAVGICDDILRSQLAQVAMTSHLNKRTCVGFVQNVIELSERRMHYYMWISVVELLLIVANVTRNCEYRTFQTIWIVKERSKRLLLHYTILKLYSLLYRFYCVEISKCRSWYFAYYRSNGIWEQGWRVETGIRPTMQIGHGPNERSWLCKEHFWILPYLNRNCKEIIWWDATMEKEANPGVS